MSGRTGDELPFRRHRRAERSGHLVVATLPRKGRQQPVAPVRERYLRGRPAGAARPARSRGRRLRSVSGAAELVGGGDEMARRARDPRHLGARSVLQVNGHLIDEPVHVLPLLAGVPAEGMVRDDEFVDTDLAVAGHDLCNLRRSADDAGKP